MNQKFGTITASILMEFTLVGCSSSLKLKQVYHAGTPLTLVNDKINDDNDMQGLRFTILNSHNDFKQEIRTAPDAKMFMKDVPKVRPVPYYYKMHELGSGDYQIIFQNNNVRDEAHSGATGTIGVSFPSYTKQSQVGIFLGASTDVVKQSIVDNVQRELKTSNILDEKAKVSIKDDDKQDINVNVDDDFTPWSPTDTIVSMLKGIKQSDLSAFEDVKFSISTNGHIENWHTFIPYDIKTMPLDNMITNDCYG